jgi:glyoxylase-like metal-dependent hydrolase (beta-lactamase superfamily II)
MMMTNGIYCLNCGSLHPYLPPIHGGVTCLLIETNEGPVLVDTGFGLGDYQEPTRLMNLYLSALRCPRDIQETAAHQVKRLGYEPAEVRHIIMTHLHLDHAGGLPDFSEAAIHLFKPEYEHAVSGRAGWAYNQRHWAHGPRWSPHDLRGEHWYDFEAVRLRDIQPEVWLVPLTGHTRGHCGVAVRKQDGWLLHAGDAVPFDAAVDRAPDWISRLLLGPHTPRIRAFMKHHPEVEVVSAHMDLAFYAGWNRGSA